MTPRLYTAATRLQVARESTDPAAARRRTSSTSTRTTATSTARSSFLATQVAILKSRDLAERVIRTPAPRRERGVPASRPDERAGSSRSAASCSARLRPRGWSPCRAGARATPAAPARRSTPSCSTATCAGSACATCAAPTSSRSASRRRTPRCRRSSPPRTRRPTSRPTRRRGSATDVTAQGASSGGSSASRATSVERARGCARAASRPRTRTSPSTRSRSSSASGSASSRRLLTQGRGRARHAADAATTS